MRRKHMLPNLITNGLHHKHRFMAIQPAAMNQPAAGLVDGNQPLILIEYLQHQWAASVINALLVTLRQLDALITDAAH